MTNAEAYLNGNDPFVQYDTAFPKADGWRA